MAQATAIGWTDLSWNPVHGCSIVSTECRNCYAATLSLRYGQTLKPWTPANAADNVTLKPHKLREPLSGAKAWRGLGKAAEAAGKDDGMLVFVNSMSDLFHPQVPYEFIGDVFRTMERAKRHTFQVLTKRPERMAEVVADLYACGLGCGELLPNVWLGVSVGLRQFVGRADVLRATPAAVRFISAEPLLGPLLDLDLTGIDWLIVGDVDGDHLAPVWFGIHETGTLNARNGREADDERHIAPLQLDFIDRCIRLWSNPGELVLTPFAGIGSELFQAVRRGRRAIGVELKPSYWQAACANLERLEREMAMPTLLDEHAA